MALMWTGRGTLCHDVSQVELLASISRVKEVVGRGTSCS